MRKYLVGLLIVAALCGLVGCGSKSSTTILNTVNKFFSNDVVLEATARELVIDGNEANVRISVMNTSEDQVDGFHARVDFLDQKGNVLYTHEQDVNEVLESYESTSITATCFGKNVGKITGVTVSDSMS